MHIVYVMHTYIYLLEIITGMSFGVQFVHSVPSTETSKNEAVLEHVNSYIAIKRWGGKCLLFSHSPHSRVYSPSSTSIWIFEWPLKSRVG